MQVEKLLLDRVMIHSVYHLFMQCQFPFFSLWQDVNILPQKSLFLVVGLMRPTIINYLCHDFNYEDDVNGYTPLLKDDLGFKFPESWIKRLRSLLDYQDSMSRRRIIIVAESIISKDRSLYICLLVKIMNTIFDGCFFTLAKVPSLCFGVEITLAFDTTVFSRLQGSSL